MANHPYKARPAGSLKDAATRLVNRCGGFKASVDPAGVSANTLFRYTDDSEDSLDRHMPVHVVRRLERACGEPVVTEFLAAEQGCALLRLPPAGLPDAWAEDLAVVMRESAEAVQQIAGDLADGKIDRAGEGIREIDEAIAVFVALRARLAAIRDGGGR